MEVIRKGPVTCRACRALVAYAVVTRDHGRVCPYCHTRMGDPGVARRRERAAVRDEVALSTRERLGPEWVEFLGSEGVFDLGVSGRPLREDGESHREWWKRTLRYDMCAICGSDGGTVDHIEPQSRWSPMTHTWLNYIGMCSSCNGSKGDESLMLWMARRAIYRPVRRRAA